MNYELLLSLRGRATRTALALLLVAGALALLLGTQRRARELAAFDELRRSQATARADLLKKNDPATADLGLFLYYLALPAVNEPSSGSIVARGQRDAHATAIPLRFLALVPQLDQGELTNPLALATGTLDLAFVILFLAPLALIAMSYSVLTEERESGVDRMLRTQARSLRGLVARRILLRALLVLGAVSLLLGAAVAAGTALREGFAFLAVTAVYLALWTGVVWLAVVLATTTRAALVLLVSVWVLWSVVIPSIASAELARRYSTSPAVELSIRHREAVHGSWDRRQGPFSWSWYYGMQEGGDRAVAADVNAWRGRIEARHRASLRVGTFAPPILAQMLFNDIAATGTPAHLAFRDSVEAYHDALHAKVRPMLPRNPRLAELDLASLPRHQHRGEPEVDPLSLLTLIAIAAGLLVAAWLASARIDRAERAAPLRAAISAAPEIG